VDAFICYKQKCKVVSLNLAHPVGLHRSYPAVDVIQGYKWPHTTLSSFISIYASCLQTIVSSDDICHSLTGYGGYQLQCICTGWAQNPHM